MSPRTDVLVVGAGPAGSATAFHLAASGVPVTLLDRAAFPREKACSEYLSPEAVRLLERIGVVAQLERAGAQPLHGTTVFAPRGSQVTGHFAGTTVPPLREAGLAIARRVLDTQLVRAAQSAGATLLERTTVLQLIHESGAIAGAVVRDADGGCRTIRARVTVGADGLRSIVARRIGRRRHGSPARVAFVAHVAGVPGLEGLAELHVGDAGYAGLNRIGPGVANVALVVPREGAFAARGNATRFFLTELERFPAVRGRIPGGGIVRPVMVTGPFSAWSGRVVADGALLVGDAADFFDPFTGQGITAALRGAELAAASLLPALEMKGMVTAHRLAGYRAARRSAFLGKWAVERLVGYGMLAPRLFDRAVARLHRHGLGDTFVAVAGDLLPARAVLDPRVLLRMML